MITYIIKNEKDYKHLKKRAKKGEGYLKDKWTNPDYKKEVGYWLAMEGAILEWEIDNCGLDKEIDKFGEEMDRR